jgi:DNA-binding MarR family transcriptional regulator
MLAMKDSPPGLTALTTYLLSKTGKAARGRLAAELSAEGLRLWHMAALAALADFGPQVQRELAGQLRVDPSDMVKVIDELAGSGCVERTRDTADRRRVRVTLTPAGSERLAALTARAETVQNDILAPLDTAERAALHALLLRVYEALPAGPQ